MILKIGSMMIFTLFIKGVFASTEHILFTLEKSFNPENKIIIHTRTDQDCRFSFYSKNSEKNYVDFYWSMNNGKEFKDIHPMIRSEIKNRVQFLGISDRYDTFKIRLSDFSVLNHDLPVSQIEVISELSQGVCRVKSVVTLGGSSHYRKIDLKRTFCEVSKNLFGIPNGCNSLLLEGRDLHNGELIRVRFLKK
jgi:hypothetical protein